MKNVYPKILEFHPGIRCRLNCSFCYRKGKTYKNPRQPFNGDDLKKLINDFSDYGGQEIYISGGLEPFSRYNTVCHTLLLAHKNKLQTRIYTNGTEPCLQKRWIRELIINTVSQIRFSVHALSPEVYSKITGVSNSQSLINHVKENIKSLIDLSTELGPQIGIGYVVNRFNVSEVAEAADFWNATGIHFMDVRFDVMDSDEEVKYISDEMKILQNQVKRNCFSPMRIQIGDFVNKHPDIADKCYSPYHKIVVDPYGFVWSCCLKGQPGIQPSWSYLGDVTVQTYKEIIENIGNKFPRKHCPICTPYEIRINHKISQNHVQYIPKKTACMTTTEFHHLTY